MLQTHAGPAVHNGTRCLIEDFHATRIRIVIDEYVDFS